MRSFSAGIDPFGIVRGSPSPVLHVPSSGAMPLHFHEYSNSNPGSSSGSTLEVASRVTPTPSPMSTSPPFTTASRGADLTKKSNAVDDAISGFALRRPSKRSVYEVPGGRDRLGRNSLGVFDFVTSGSSSTGLPSDEAADQPKTYPSMFSHSGAICSMAAMTRVSALRGTAPSTTVEAAIVTDIEHFSHVTPSPLYPCGHGSHLNPTPGALMSLHLTPGKHGFPTHPSMSMQPVSPWPK